MDPLKNSTVEESLNNSSLKHLKDLQDYLLIEFIIFLNEYSLKLTFHILLNNQINEYF